MNKDYRLRRTILTAMGAVGNGTVRQIASALGPEWLEPNKLTSLREMLRIMERERLAMRISAGLMRGVLTNGWGGFGSDTQVAHCIVGCLEECGGSMLVDDIVDTFTDRRVWGANEWEGQRNNVRRIIEASGAFAVDDGIVRLASA